mgnify:CR=1 FL=1
MPMRIKVQSSWFYSIKNWNLWKNIVKIDRKEKVNETLEVILLIVNHAGASDHFLDWSAKASPQIAPEKDFVLRLKVDALYAMTSRRLYYLIHQIAKDFGKLWKTLPVFRRLCQTLKDFGRLWKTLEDFGKLWNTLEDFRTLMNTL